ncbi:uncharacterized protein BT62DRAFT_1013347 [Guyanagaster necrorhizus]|uniref:Uncharacterized protein n=1 Tax=Guyanagaster necrorhizus TaxID=856835 RepID=A0A9P8AMJ2_9AGAR|nr:uncharacterized protein BT62DRAFT_1013347 [Guyanagaster necrorhizus MCA 3950]KAG7439897.1 hypothetical protein BT62DRAFT_1013347 [Guyanagaster necrorhizus MCA 3950]
MFLSPFLILASLVYTTLAQQSNTNPTVDGNEDDGWQSFPDVVDATGYPRWVVDEDLGAYLPVYQTSGLNTTEVTRAVIVLHGKPRDCWYYFNAMNNALYNATYDDPTIIREHISIMGPCFFDEDDLSAGAAEEGQLLWGRTTWISGHTNVAPDSISDYSSLDVLDSLVAYYMNKTVYPNLEVVVVGGHSAGAQMAQRYAALRISTDDDDRLHFWVANPGSLVWLTSDRPVSVDDCDGVDDYKYGLADNFPAYATANARELGRSGIVERYNGRNMNYAWGLTDYANGDDRCEASAQGKNHIRRGKNFVKMLKAMGGIPNLTTVDWAANIGHSNEGMMTSEGGIDKLFRYVSNSTTS